MRQHLITDDLINKELDDAFNWFQLLWHIELMRRTYAFDDIIVFP